MGTGILLATDIKTKQTNLMTNQAKISSQQEAQ